MAVRDLPGDPASRRFFLQPTRRVARSLLGAWFVRRTGGGAYAARIVEVEAYLGLEDEAAHTFGGRRTPRVEPMYGRGGLLYVFSVYGMHWCANVVTRPEGRPEAVLIRAAEGPRGHERLLAGPGKFCRAFGIGGAFSGRDLVDGAGLEIRLDPVPAHAVAAGPRIGVDYAGRARDWPLRYAVAGSPALSRPMPSIR
jgi:DNA-3-methyladenine glycosylase